MVSTSQMNKKYVLIVIQEKLIERHPPNLSLLQQPIDIIMSDSDIHQLVCQSISQTLYQFRQMYRVFLQVSGSNGYHCDLKELEGVGYDSAFGLNPASGKVAFLAIWSDCRSLRTPTINPRSLRSGVFYLGTRLNVITKMFKECKIPSTLYRGHPFVQLVLLCFLDKSPPVRQGSLFLLPVTPGSPDAEIASPVSPCLMP